MKLQNLADRFLEKVECGEARKPANQYKTVKGFKFDPSELSEDQRNSKLERLSFEIETGQLTEEERKSVEAERASLMGYEKHVQKREKEMKDPVKRAEHEVKRAQRMMSSAKTSDEKKAAGDMLSRAIQAKTFAEAGVVAPQSHSSSSSSESGVDRKQDGTHIVPGAGGNYKTTIMINDYPQVARWRIMNKDTQYGVTELSQGAAIVGKGVYVQPGTKPTASTEPLHLVLEADTEIILKRAVKEINRILEEETLRLATGRTLGSNTTAITSRYGDKYGDI